MGKFILLLLVFSFELAWAQAPDPEFNDKAAYSESRIYRKSTGFQEPDNFASFDLVYQRLNFNVDPAVNFISGSVFSSVKFLNDNVGQISFDLNDVMVVDSVYYDGKRISAEHQGNKIWIASPVAANTNGIANVEVFYHGEPPQNGMGSFVSSKHGNSPVIWTLSEPYGSKDWWPCKESLSDKIDSVDIFITCPQQYLGASNGKLVDDIVAEQKRTAHWKHKYPIATYLIGIAVTNYQTYSDFLELDGGKKIEVLNYVYPEYLATAKTKSTDILNILAFYNKKFTTYPFATEKYGHAQFGWGGGMEHQTMSFMTTFDFELVAHEMAHQWFGDYITLASWHDIWLNEGFATYLTGLSFENLLDGQYWSSWKNIQVNRITFSPDGSVYVTDTTNINRIFNGRLSYSKGAYLLHMLRWEIGDSLFFKGMNDYLEDRQLAYGFASHDKFVKHMETLADTSFTEFFNDWYYGEGFPTYRLVYYIDDTGQQKLKISQTPSNPSVGFFEMHVPVRVWQGGKYRDLRLYNTAPNQEFDIGEGNIDKVEFDPEKWLIAKADIADGTIHISEATQIHIISEDESNSIRVLIPGHPGKGILRVVDLNGQIVKSAELNASDTKTDVSQLQRRIYLVEAISGNQRVTEKIFLGPNRTK